MRLSVDFEQRVPRQPLPIGDYDLKVVAVPYLINPEKDVLVVELEAQVSRELRQAVNPVLPYQVKRDPDRGWNIEPMWDFVQAFDVPYDGEGLDTEDFLHRVGRGHVEHQFVEDAATPTPYIRHFVVPR